jgi:hypothetical protein
MNHLRKVILLWIVMAVGLTLSCRETNLEIGKPPEIEWQKIYGGKSDEFGFKARETFDGNYVVVGYSNSFDDGKQKAYILSVDKFGDTLWSKTYGGSSESAAHSFQQTSDSGYIVCGYIGDEGSDSDLGNQDVYLLKLDKEGEVLWERSIGGFKDDCGFSVSETRDKGYIIAGGTCSFSLGMTDLYLIKTDSLGNTLWSRTFGGERTDVGMSVHEIPKVGYLIAGTSNSFDSGFNDILAIRTDSLGNTIWMKTFGGSSNDMAFCSQRTTDGNYVILGHSIVTKIFGNFVIELPSLLEMPRGSENPLDRDMYAVKLDANGRLLWKRAYGSHKTEYGQSIWQTSDNGFVLCGTAVSLHDKRFSDIYVLKTDSKGEPLWGKRYGGERIEFAFSAQQTSDGGYIVAGNTRSYGAKGMDILLIKLRPEE